MNRYGIAEQQKRLDLEKAELDRKEREESKKRYLANRESRERAKQKQLQLEPFITAYVKRELKEGDYIQCKGYRGVKKVVELTDNSVIAICGWVNRKSHKFEPNGSGSQSSLSNVTEILKEGKWQKVKDLIKDYKF